MQAIKLKQETWKNFENKYFNHIEIKTYCERYIVEDVLLRLYKTDEMNYIIYMYQKQQFEFPIWIVQNAAVNVG